MDEGTMAIYRERSAFTGIEIDGDMQVCFPNAEMARANMHVALSKPLYLIHIKVKRFEDIPARYWARVAQRSRTHG